MFGPKNKILGIDFVKLVANSINEYSSLGHFPYVGDQSTENNKYDVEQTAKVMYRDYLNGEPKIIYNDEEFYITNLQITNKPLHSYERLDYKSELNMYNSKELPTFCRCNEDEDTDDDDQVDEITILSLDSIAKIKFNGTCKSVPNMEMWCLEFKYAEEDSGVYMKLHLGPKRHIKYKAIHAHGSIGRVKTGYENPHYGISQPIFAIDENKLVYNYRPNDLYFDEDFIKIIKNCISNKINIVHYNQVDYELLDYVFYAHKNSMFSCGCYYANSKVISSEEGIALMPNHLSYRYEFSFSFTLEWHIKVTFGSFQSFGPMSAAFILTPKIH